MQSTCISLWTQKYNKSKEPCISLTRRAAWLNMSFCPSVLCPAKFPHHGTSSQKPALIPISSACSRWALAGQGKAGADQQNGLWESCGFQLLFKGWLCNMQAREDRVRLFSEVLRGAAMNTNCNTRNSDQVWGNILSLWGWPKIGPHHPGLWILCPWRYLRLDVALRQPDLTGHDLSRGWSGQPPGVASNLHYSIVLWPGDKLLFRGALADQYDLICLGQKFPAWIWWCLNIRWSSWGFWGENSALRQMQSHIKPVQGFPQNVPETL